MRLRFRKSARAGVLLVALSFAPSFASAATDATTGLPVYPASTIVDTRDHGAGCSVWDGRLGRKGERIFSESLSRCEQLDGSGRPHDRVSDARRKDVGTGPWHSIRIVHRVRGLFKAGNGVTTSIRTEVLTTALLRGETALSASSCDGTLEMPVGAGGSYRATIGDEMSL
jgi:hypothetical protein